MADEQPCRPSGLVTVVATIVDQVRIMLRRDNVQPLAAEGAVAVEEKTLASRKGPRLVSFCTPAFSFELLDSERSIYEYGCSLREDKALTAQRRHSGVAT